MKPILLLMFLTFFSTVFSQNLVPNPSFEDTVACPNGFSQIWKAKDWFRWGLGTPDYFNYCSSNFASAIPNNYFGHQLPVETTCNAYAGFFTFTIGTNEYSASQLISPLSIGQKYFVSFRVSLGDTCKIASNNIGALFRVTLFNDTTNPFPFTNFAHINSINIISEKVNWTTVSGILIADSAYKYMVIGNFFSDTLTDTIHVDGTATQAYYYIDDICVSSDSITCNPFTFVCNTGINVKGVEHDNVINIFPNPFRDNVNIILPFMSKNALFFIYNLFGEEIYSGNIPYENYSINMSNYSTGVYFLKIQTENQGITKKLIIAH